MRHPLSTAGEVVAWWAATLGVWLLTLSSVTAADLEVAIPCAFACGGAAVVVRRTLGGEWSRPVGTGAWLLRLLPAIASDTALVLALPWRRGSAERVGELKRIPVAPGATSRARTTRAVASLLLSATPGSFVVHTDDDTGELLVHSLVGGPVDLAEAMRR